MVRELVKPATGGVRRLPMSYGEFLERFDENAHVEWVNGEAIVHMPPVEPHQDVVTLLVTLLRFYVDLRGLGMVLTAPFELRLPTGSSREPDILFLSREHYDRRTRERWIGAADLLVEVQSDRTAKYDLHEKLLDYLRAGVREYWAIDSRPRVRSFRAFLLTESGQYDEATLDERGRFRSTVLPGFWLDPSWFWQDPLPATVDLLMEIAPDAFGR
ncbi:MAG TPA: Uma2 family endonuclease [Thermomicrobiales bacterium]|jgi:Uma2 family endonuclease